jgi:hypothetical protein
MHWFWWVMQYPIWWIAPNSRLFGWVRYRYAISVLKWLKNGRVAQRDRAGLS